MGAGTDPGPGDVVDTGLAAAVAELCGLVAGGTDLAAIAVRICEHARSELDVDGAAIWSAVDRDRVRLLAAAPAEFDDVQRVQADTGLGPVTECLRTGAPVVVPAILTTDGRWPEFSTICASVGISSAAAIALPTTAGVLGCLALFGAERNAAAVVDAPAARALAGLAGLAMLIDTDRTVNRQLYGALESRVLIEQAQGMLAEHLGISPGEALSTLHGYARAHRRLVHEVAADIIAGTVVLTAPRD